MAANAGTDLQREVAVVGSAGHARRQHDLALPQHEHRPADLRSPRHISTLPPYCCPYPCPYCTLPLLTIVAVAGQVPLLSYHSNYRARYRSLPGA